MKQGYQPTHSNLNPTRPPKGGSGVPIKQITDISSNKFTIQNGRQIMDKLKQKYKEGLKKEWEKTATLDEFLDKVAESFTKSQIKIQSLETVNSDEYLNKT